MDSISEIFSVCPSSSLQRAGDRCLAGLAIDAIARSMSAESSRAIRLTTLRQMAKVIARAIESIEPET